MAASIPLMTDEGKYLAMKPARGEAEAELHGAGEHERREEDVEAAELADGGEDDGSEAGGGAADHEVRAAERCDDETADDAGDEARHEGRTGGQGHAEAERERHQEDDEGRGKVGADVVTPAGAWCRHFGVLELGGCHRC